MSTVAIIMATYNGEKYVGEQIDSILASTYQDFRLFIYDDGSSDNTMSILQHYADLYPSKVTVCRNETNLGVTANFLKAFSRTTMDYIMFCDQDDVWKPNKIAITLRRLRNMEAQLGKNTPLAVFTDAVVVDSHLNTLKPSFFRSSHLNPSKTDLAHLLMENKLIGCTVMVNAALRVILQSYPLPSNARFHDWWIALIASAVGKIGYVNEGTMLYRQHSANVVGGAGFRAYVANRLVFLKNQREAINSLRCQAEEFLKIYGEILSEEKKKIIRDFVNLENQNFLLRRWTILRNGYLKTGIIRNVGLMIIL